MVVQMLQLHRPIYEGFTSFRMNAKTGLTSGSDGAPRTTRTHLYKIYFIIIAYIMFTLGWLLSGVWRNFKITAFSQMTSKQE